MNLSEHIQNRNHVPQEELRKYENQHVAWNLDGTCILAGDSEPLRLVARLKAEGYDSGQYVLSFVDPVGVNWSEHVKNRNAVPIEHLLPYENQHVAWSLDGTHVIAGDADPLRLVARLKEAGYPTDGFILSFVNFDTDWGGAF